MKKLPTISTELTTINVLIKMRSDVTGEKFSISQFFFQHKIIPLNIILMNEN